MNTILQIIFFTAALWTSITCISNVAVVMAMINRGDKGRTPAETELLAAILWGIFFSLQMW